jgi:glycosyltransferase involved in cell wall biosynthesis
MKVIHATNYFLPEVMGGIETYIHHLTRLHQTHIESIVALPNYGEPKQTYVYDSHVVKYFPAPPPSSRAPKRRIYAEFKDWLGRQQADVYHQHSLVPPIGILQLAAAKSLNLRTVVTIHEPSAFCLRQTVMEFGTSECDGKVDELACTRCFLSGKKSPLVQLAAAIPLPISSVISSMPKIGRFRALGTKDRVADRLALLSGLSDTADCIVAISGWLQETLEQNGCDPRKISYVPNAAPRAVGIQTPQQSDEGVLTIGFIGRASPLKGLDMLISAVTAIDRSVNLRVIIHAATGPHSTVFDEVLAQAATDPRIQVEGALPHDSVLKFMASIDVLAVPSQWKECAPLVVVEALSVGTPVLGSRLGAIKEQIRDGLDGFLLPHDQPAEWTKAMERLAVDRTILQRLRKSLRRPQRSMDDVAAEMSAIYNRLLSGVV